jgi:hypothetical protein
MPIVIQSVSLEQYLLWLSSQNSPPNSPLHNPYKLPKLGMRLTQPPQALQILLLQVLRKPHPLYILGM